MLIFIEDINTPFPESDRKFEHDWTLHLTTI